jgi:inner membrane transporter RhtA
VSKKPPVADRLRHYGARIAKAGDAIPAPIFLIAALILLQLGSGFAKSIMSAENVLSLAFIRLALGGVFLVLVFRPRVLLYSRTQWFDACLLGMAFAFTNATSYLAIVALPLGLAATIGFLGPIALSVIGARRAIDYLWPVIGFAGVLLLTPLDGAGTVSWLGIGYGLTNAVAWALYILAASRAGASIPGTGGFVVATIVAALALAPLGLVGADYFFSTPELAWTTLAIVLFAIFPLVLEFVALVRLQPRVFGVLLSLEPAIATMIGMALLGERLGLLGWLALGCVSVASIGVTLTRHPREKLPHG